MKSYEGNSKCFLLLNSQEDNGRLRRLVEFKDVSWKTENSSSIKGKLKLLLQPKAWEWFSFLEYWCPCASESAFDTGR